jgi:hypothetical protein
MLTALTGSIVQEGVAKVREELLNNVFKFKMIFKRRISLW